MPCQSERQSNLDRVAHAVSDLAEQGTDIICLQELPFDPYFCQSEDHSQFDRADSLDGLLNDFSSELARRHQVILLAGWFERRAPGLFHNSCAVYERTGDRIGVYRKTHIPDDPSFYEKFYFTPGDNDFPVFDTSAGKIGICICWDQWFPEAARLAALNGAEILFFPTAIGWQSTDKQDCGDSQIDAWTTMLRSHAIANGIFVAAPNRCGVENGIEFWGSSLIIDPYGNLLASGSRETSELLTADCDLSLIETARTHWPFLRDRRIDLYADLTKRWRQD